MSERDRTLDDGDTGDFPVVWRESRDGLSAEVVAEEYVESYMNPRDSECNLGVMVCWHPDYVLGDFQLKDGDGWGAVETLFEHAGRIRSIGMLARWAGIVERAPVVIPLYLYDHSGISISTGMAVGETLSGGYDEFGNPRGWDTTLCGIIYTTPARILELCGEPQLESDRFYCPRTWPEDGRSGPNWPRERSAEAWLAAQLKLEVALYDRYLRGEVYGWRVVDEGEWLDSCGGYLPDVSDACGPLRGRAESELDYVKQEAREALESECVSRAEAAEAERLERERAARMGVATVEAGR